VVFIDFFIYIINN